MIEYTDNEMQIDLREVMLLIWKHLFLIIEAGLCMGALIFLFVSIGLPNTYVSTTEVYILHQQSDRNTVTASDLQTGSYLTNDYRELIVSLPVLEKVIAQLNLSVTPEQLEKKITVHSPDDTRIIQIAVENEDPYQAHLIAETLRISAADQIARVMDIETVKVVQNASYPDKKAGPARMKMTLAGCAFGALMTAVFLILRHIMDDTIKNPEDIESVLELFVLGSIPIMESGKKRQR